AVAGEVGVGPGIAHVEVAARRLPADLAEELPHVGGRVVAPAVLLEQIAGQEVVHGLAVAADLELGRAARERAAVGLEQRPRILKTALRHDRECAAERVETEYRVGSGDQVDRGNGRLRY